MAVGLMFSWRGVLSEGETTHALATVKNLAHLAHHQNTNVYFTKPLTYCKSEK